MMNLTFFFRVFAKFWFFVIFLCSCVYADLRVGDFVLLPMNCYACRVISSETGSPYSHLGMIVAIGKKEILLVESLGSVRIVSLSTFQKRMIPGFKLGFYRLKEWDQLYKSDREYFEQMWNLLISDYYNHFEGLPYDGQFLWDNFDIRGKEKLYCSEFLTKLVNPFLKNKIGTHPMNYLKNWDFWMKTMGRRPPQGKEGNNPSFFVDSKLFFQLDG